MAVTLGICLISFAVGALVPAMTLPEIGPGRVARLALIVVCALVGIALVVLALEIYETASAIGGHGAYEVAGDRAGHVAAQGIAGALRDAGPLIGLAAVVYLLAAKPSAGVSGEEPGLGGPV